MSSERNEPYEPYEDRDVLQWYLDPSSRTPETERALEESSELRESLGEFEASVSGLRSALLQEESERIAPGESVLVDEILRATTREDLSVRGDLALVRDFLGRRLSGSWVLKLVAASLVVHLSALPILGFMLLTEPAGPQLYLSLEKPIELPFEEDEQEPEREVDGTDFVDPEEWDELLQGKDR